MAEYEGSGFPFKLQYIVTEDGGLIVNKINNELKLDYNFPVIEMSETGVMRKALSITSYSHPLIDEDASAYIKAVYAGLAELYDSGSSIPQIVALYDEKNEFVRALCLAPGNAARQREMNQ